MKEVVVYPGNIVVTQMSGYQHWSLVSDRRCYAGKFMLISATKRTGTVQEETWDEVIGGRPTYVASLTPKLPVYEVLAHARSHIGQWNYSVTSSNCEHFVKLVTGFEMTSQQVQAGVVGGIGGAVLAGKVLDNPNTFQILGFAALVAGVAVFASKAAAKPE